MDNTQPDSSGGLGSFLAPLLGELTGGLKLVAAGELQRRYGFSFGADGNVAVNADGTIKQASAPAKNLTLGDSVGAALKNPIALAAMVAAGIALVVVIVKR